MRGRGTASCGGGVVESRALRAKLAGPDGFAYLGSWILSEALCVVKGEGRVTYCGGAHHRITIGCPALQEGTWALLAAYDQCPRPRTRGGK